jgi:arylsulfatase A-like enzyme
MELQKRIYYGAITAMDEQMGRLWFMLEKLDIQEETIIMFCSDNGPENNTPGSASIFRERKRSLYEGGVRVPAFVVWKGHINGGSRLNFPSVTSDYLPTILEILKIEYPDSRPLDGESIWPLLLGKKKTRDKSIGFIFRERQSWVDNQYKLISTDGGKNFELYDLINDKSEKENIINKEPETASKMKQNLLEWLASVDQSKKGFDYN